MANCTRSPSAPIRLSPDILQRNLTALSAVDPDLARQIQQFDPAAAGWQLAPTRDGQLSYQRSGEHGETLWLGRSSLPAVRAEALLEQFDPGRANVLMPGIAEGSEVVALLARLGCHRAVFVWEHDVAQLALVLRLHDFSDGLRTLRLVLLCCAAEDLSDHLLNWLRRSPGHLCPERLMMWPWQTLAEIAGLRAAVETAFRSIEQERRAALDELAKKRRAQPASLDGSSGGLVILGLHAREDVWSLGESLDAAARTSGRTCALALLRGPGDVHPLAFARRLAAGHGERRELGNMGNVRAEGQSWRTGHEYVACASPERDPAAALVAGNVRMDRAILLEVTRHSVRDVLDERTRAVTWIGTSGGIPSDVAQQMGPADHLAVPSAELQQEALASGVPAQRVHIVPPACLADLDDAEPSRSRGLVLMANLTSQEPEAHGIRLPTHCQLWQAVLGEIQSHTDGLSLQGLEALLTKAEQRLGIDCEETLVRQSMRRGLIAAAQSIYCIFIAKQLRQLAIPLRIAGSGWMSPLADDPQPVTWTRRTALTREATAVLHLDLAGRATDQALLAAGSGALLIALATPLDEAAGGLGTLLKACDEYIPFKTLRGLLGSLEQLARQPQHGEAIASRARARCRREHSPVSRLAALDAILSS